MLFKKKWLYSDEIGWDLKFQVSNLIIYQVKENKNKHKADKTKK